MTENKKTILLVEDEVILALAEARMLEKHGYAVITASTGEEAVEAVKREKGIDLILMDIDLGRGMDGTEAAEIILKERNVPVMFLSSHTEPAVVKKTEGITSYGYVVKNSGETVLLASIRMAFRLFIANERIDHQREDLELANEELQATVEDLEATSEELQVTVEELRVTSEEFQASNEELACSQKELLAREAEIDFERKQLLSIFDGIHQSIYVSDLASYEVLFVNKSLRDLLDRDPVGGICYREFQGLDRPCDFCTNEKIIAMGGEALRWVHHNDALGRSFELADRIIRWPDGRNVRFELAVDITERRRAEEALIGALDDLNRSQEISGTGSWTWDLADDRFNASRTGLALFGFSSDAHPTFAEVAERIHPEDRPLAREVLMKSLGTGEPYSVEIRVVRADTGIEITVLSSAEIEKGSDGKPVRVIGVNRDITGQKRMEEALHRSESAVRNKLSVILSPEGDLDALELGDIIDVEAIQALMDEFHRLTNIGIGIIDLNGNVLVGTGWQDICVNFHRVNPLTLKNCLESDISLSAGVEPGAYRIYRCKNNMYDMATPIIVGKRHAGNLFLGQFFFDDESPDVDFFREQARKFGFNEEEYLAALDRVPRWSRETVDAVMSFYTKFANMISTLSHGNIVLARIVGELDSVNAELRRSEERYRVLAENTSDVIWMADLNLKTTYVSPSVERLIGDNPEIHMTRTMEERFFPEDLEYLSEVFMEEMEKEKDPLCDRNRSRMVEVRHRKSDGSWIWVEINMSAFRDEEGNMIGILGVSRDISSRKNAEEALETAFLEKKTLLRELQHRVKNSMSMITSLIHLEQDRAVDVPVRTALEDLHGRVSVLSNLYGLLYVGDSMEISTGEYLRKIAGSLSEAFSDRKMVRLNVKFDDVLINPKIASTLGLIMNELVTNAYKYAFHDDRTGTVRVELSRRNGELELLVADNGAGPPEGFNPESASGFGLELVRMLVRQIKGRLEYERDRETVFRVMWKEF